MKFESLSHNQTTGSRTTCGRLPGLLALVALLVTSASLKAEDPPPESRVHALVNMEFSDHYLTPRGMNVQDSGLVFQPLVLGIFNVYKADTFINHVDLVAGVWNCFGTDKIPSSDSGGAKGTSWYEIDPIAGISTGLGKYLTLDVTYTAFNMQILNIPFSQHLETKLTLDDSAYMKKFALHPTIIFWRELDGKAVANTDANPQSSYYFDLGVAPSYTFETAGLKLEAPCRVLMADDKFYGTGAGKASTLGLYEVGAKASMPLKFMPKGYGNWGFHAGVKYMGLEDVNLRATQGKSGVWQFYCGLSTFF